MMEIRMLLMPLSPCPGTGSEGSQPLCLRHGLRRYASDIGRAADDTRDTASVLAGTEGSGYDLCHYLSYKASLVFDVRDA